MRDLMFLAGFLVLLPLAFSNAFVAYLIWGWTAIISIEDYLFGFMEGLRYNLIFGIVSLVLVLIKRDKIRGTSLFNSGTFVLLALFLVQATVSAVFAYEGNPLNWLLYERFVKILMFAFVMPLIVVGRYRIHAMVIMICLGLGFHGLIDGLKFLSSGGSHVARGFSKFGDNNHYAVTLVMVIPLLLYLVRYSSRRLVRLGGATGGFLNIAAIIATRSRGGFLSLLAMGLWLIVTSKQRLTGLLMLAATTVLLVALVPSSWTERMETIKEVDQESSFMTRVEAWQVSSAIALTNPMTGGGLHSVQVQWVWDYFKGSKGLLPFIDVGFVSNRMRAAHSIYFEVLGDTGFVGLFLFMSLLLNAMFNALRVKRLVRGREDEFSWAIDLSKSLNAILAGFIVGGASVSLAYSDVIYMVIMLSEILRREVADSIASRSAGNGNFLMVGKI